MLAVYFVLFPLGAMALVISHYTIHQDHVVVGLLGFVNWPLPWVFGLGSATLLVDFWRRLGSGQLTSTQVVGYRVAAVLMVLGAAFSLSSGHWLPVAVSGVALILMFLPTRGRTVPSTWERS